MGGYIPGVQGWFKIQKPIGIIYHINRRKKKTHMTVSTDEGKVFNKINTQGLPWWRSG